jgi:hypothetical protein
VRGITSPACALAFQAGICEFLGCNVGRTKDLQGVSG